MENLRLRQLLVLLDTEVFEELESYIEASRCYYTDDAIMTDSEFDELTEKLLNYNIPELTEYIESGVYKVNEGLEQVLVTSNEMISLKKLKWKDKSSVAGIKSWFNPKLDLYEAPKMDGCALKITWNLETKIIISIISRGGLLLTEMFKNHPHILDTIKYNKTIITGELVIHKALFDTKYSIDGDNEYEYENARNFVGSLIKCDSISQEMLLDLYFVPLTDGLNPLLDTPYWRNISRDQLYNLEQTITKYKSADFPFMCDGIVLAQIEADGIRKIKDNYPLNMLAIKFPGARAKSKVIGFEWSQKKSGNLTPKVMIEPVKLEGSTMTCANGYNYQNLIDKHIGIGSEIEIEKSGDIIPVVAKVLTRSNNITLPKVQYNRKGKHLIAVDLENTRKYKFNLGLRLLNIEGIGETLAEQIGSIVNYSIIELFNQNHKPDICNKLGGGKIWQRFQEFYNIKTLHLDTLIALLQFDGVGPVLSKRVALLITGKSKDSSNMSSHVLSNVCKGEGFALVNSSVKILHGYGVRVLAPVEISEDSITFEMTGDVPGGISKAEFVKKLHEKYPNAIHTTLKKDTKYLICDSLTSESSKSNKARKDNIKIITYEQALTMKL